MQSAPAEPLPESVAPLTYRAPPHDPVRYEVLCLPPLGRDLSFKQLYEADGAKRTAYYEMLGRTFSNLNLRTVIAPKPNFNAVVDSPTLFTEELKLKFGVTIKRPVLAIEGTELAEYEGGAFTAGGCPFLVLSYVDGHAKKRILFAHAGTGSLIDLEHALHRHESRPHESIVDALVDYATLQGAQPEWMTLRCFFSIPSEAYQYSLKDPIHKSQNRLLFDYLLNLYGETSIFEKHDGHEHMNLETLIMVQAERRGIVRRSFHCTLPKAGAFAHTRHANPELSGLARNLEVIAVY